MKKFYIMFVELFVLTVAKAQWTQQNPLAHGPEELKKQKKIRGKSSMIKPVLRPMKNQNPRLRFPSGISSS